MIEILCKLHGDAIANYEKGRDGVNPSEWTMS